MRKVPRVRFKGFIDEWQECKLGEVAKIVGGGTPSTNILEYWDGNINWYSPAELGDKIYINSSQRKITELGLEKSSAKILPKGTILYTSRAGIGNTAILNSPGSTNQGFQSIVPDKNKLDTYFIFSRTNKLKKYGETIGAGSTFVEVSGKQMENMDLFIPNLKEQNELGCLLKEKDKSIIFEQAIIEWLEKFKKALLEKMFANGKIKIPEIRHKGFADDWEQRKLGEIFKYERPDKYIPVSDEYEEYGITPVLTANKAFVLGYTNETNCYTKNSIIFDDFTLECKYVDFPYMVRSSAIKILTNRDSKNENLYFNYCLLANTKLENLGHARHYISVVQPTEVCAPNEEEAIKISEFVNRLDNLITLHQRKCKKLEKIRESLLEQMLV